MHTAINTGGSLGIDWQLFGWLGKGLSFSPKKKNIAIYWSYRNILFQVGYFQTSHRFQETLEVSVETYM